MKKKTLALLLTCLMIIPMVLTGCGGDSSGGQAVTDDGRDESGKIVDLTAYAISLGEQWFTEEDNEIWAHIEDPSDNPDKVVIRVSATTRSFDESPCMRGEKRQFIELKKAMGDRVEIQLYMNASLGGTADQILGGLQAGNFEYASYNAGAWYEYTKAFTPMDIGFLIPDLEAGSAICAYGSPTREIMVNKALEDTGLLPMHMGCIGMRHITTANTPIATLDDLNGLKIRVQNNNLHMAMFDTLGSSPTPIAFSELFTALQQKTVDGQENPIANIFEQNYVEVQKCMTLSNHLYTAGCSAVNYEWFKSLPQDMQDAWLAGAAMGQEQSYKDLVSCEQAMMEYMESQGMEILSLSDAELAKFQEVSESLYPMAAEVMGQDYWNEVKAAIDEVIAGL